MIKIIALPVITFTLFSLSLRSQTTPGYDSLLAKRTGADERGMKRYVLVILKTGPNKMEKGPALDSMFAGHMRSIGRLADSGKLAVAGPLVKNDDAYRGIFVMNASTIEEAKKLCAEDPTIKAGIFDASYYEWYSTAAMMEIPALHKKLEKKR
jgi:uncharacterized protein